MDKIWWGTGIGVYVLLFMFAIIGIALWRSRQRNERPPVAFKLLRGPGETLRRRVQKFDENLPFTMLWAALLPLAPGLLVLQGLIKFAPKTPLIPGLALSFAAWLLASLITGKWVYSKFVRYRNDHLGHMGERAVAEALSPLLSEGFRIFHDVPAKGAQKEFNLDHVVVGATGVYLIETKTRRKGRAVKGRKEHEVTFDGNRLIWPWGEDRSGLDQATGEAAWLSAWIRQLTNITVMPKPIVALPGWKVLEKTLGAVRVLNHKNLASCIRGRAGKDPVLDLQQIDLIARQLDQVCRDVED
jgi:hypothetical protein